MLKWVFSISISLALLCLVYFFVAPVIIEKSKNKVSSDFVQVEDETKAFHQQLFIADMHADSLLWKRNLLISSYRGHTDFKRMQAGNLSLQFFTVVTKVPPNLNIESNSADKDIISLLVASQLWPPRTWTSLYERALYQAEKLHKLEERAKDYFVIVKSKSDLQQLIDRRKHGHTSLAGILGLEGAHALEQDLKKNMHRLFEAGYRMMAPTHFFDNDFAGSAHGREKQGLRPLGVDFVRQANAMNIIMDVAHASAQTIEDILKVSSKPIVVSHTGLKGHCNNSRNLQDALAKKIARGGGLIAIGFWPSAVCGSTTRSIAQAITYAVKLVGEDHVALGSDFDGAVTVPFVASQMSWLTQELLEQGLSKHTIKKVMGENVLEFLKNNLPER